MRSIPTGLLSAAAVCVGLALALAPAAPARGQKVAQPSWRGRPALASRGHPGLALAKVQGQDVLATAGMLQEPTTLSVGPLQPAVTVERHGRLLVLTYRPKSADGGLPSNAGPRGEAPEFTVYQGQRKIASGQFEYG